MESRNGPKRGPVPCWHARLRTPYRRPRVRAWSVDGDRIDAVTVGVEGVGQALNLGGVARFARDLDLGALCGQRIEDPLVGNFDDAELELARYGYKAEMITTEQTPANN